MKYFADIEKIKERDISILFLANLSLICEDCGKQFTKFDNRFIIIPDNMVGIKKLNDDDVLILGLIAIDDSVICKCFIDKFTADTEKYYPYPLLITIPKTTEIICDIKNKHISSADNELLTIPS